MIAPMLNPIAMLTKRLKTRDQRTLAHELGISESYLCDVLKGRKEPGESILEPLGLERVIRYRRRNGH